eukprot:30963-Pelagococcus_subviridis.AAC.1
MNSSSGCRSRFFVRPFPCASASPAISSCSGRCFSFFGWGLPLYGMAAHVACGARGDFLGGEAATTKGRSRPRARPRCARSRRATSGGARRNAAATLFAKAPPTSTQVSTLLARRLADDSRKPDQRRRRSIKSTRSSPRAIESFVVH